MDIMDQRANSLFGEDVKGDAVLSAIGEGSSDAITQVDANGVILAWTTGAERMMGYQRDEIVGQKIDLIIPSEMLEESLNSIRDQFSGNMGILHEETVRLHKSGKRIPVTLTRVPLTNDKGEIVALLAILKDVSEQRKLQKTIENLQRNTAMAKVAAKVAHEIRTPLGVLFLKSDMLTERMQNAFEEWGGDNGEFHQRKIEKCVHDIQKQINRLEEIANNYLHLSKSRAMERQVIRLPKLVKDIAKELTEQYKSSGVKIVTQVDEEVPPVDIDPQQFQRVVANLVRNSIEALTSSKVHNGKVTVAVSHNPNQVLLEVRDNGPGMPDDILEDVFDPFITTKSIGTGLGLYLVKEIVTNHGGEIAIDSGQDQGTAVRIMLSK